MSTGTSPAPTPDPQSRKIARILLAALFVALLVGMFTWTGHWMIARWEQDGGYYSHGWLIVPVSLFLLYRRRRELAACPRRASPWGMLMLAPFLLLHLLATAWQVGFLSGFALIGVLAGLVLTLFGRHVLRIVLFPIIFLAFMVPLPQELIEILSFNLKMAAARVATRVVNVLGLVAVRGGSRIRIPNGSLVVDDVCSGLKYLIALTAFAAIYAHISTVKRWGKAILFFLAIPISFLANVSRVTLMVVVAYYWGVHTSTKWYFHDGFGFALFIFAFVTLFLVESLMLRRFRIRRLRSLHASPDSDAGPPPKPKAPSAPQVGTALTVTVLVMLLLATGLSVFLARPRPTLDASDKLAAVPLNIGDWRGRDIFMSERVYKILGTRDVLSRSYTHADGRRVMLSVVLAFQARRRTHAPEHCYTGDGFLIQSTGRRVLSLPLHDGTTALHLRELVLQRKRETRVVWYFYKSGAHLNTNYWRHQLGVAVRKLADPNAADILIRSECTALPDETDSARDVLRGFLAAAMPHILAGLP